MKLEDSLQRFCPWNRRRSLYWLNRKLYLSWTTNLLFFFQVVFFSLHNLQLSPVFECWVNWNHLAFNLLFILSTCMSLFSIIQYEDIFGKTATLGSRTELICVDKFNRRTSDGLMWKYSNFLSSCQNQSELFQ